MVFCSQFNRFGQFEILKKQFLKIKKKNKNKNNWAFKPNIYTSTCFKISSKYNREAEPKQLKAKCNANKIDIDFHVNK